MTINSIELDSSTLLSHEHVSYTEPTGPYLWTYVSHDACLSHVSVHGYWSQSNRVSCAARTLSLLWNGLPHCTIDRRKFRLRSDLTSRGAIGGRNWGLISRDGCGGGNESDIRARLISAPGVACLESEASDLWAKSVSSASSSYLGLGPGCGAGCGLMRLHRSPLPAWMFLKVVLKDFLYGQSTGIGRRRFGISRYQPHGI